MVAYWNILISTIWSIDLAKKCCCFKTYMSNVGNILYIYLYFTLFTEMLLLLSKAIVKQIYNINLFFRWSKKAQYQFNLQANNFIEIINTWHLVKYMYVHMPNYSMFVQRKTAQLLNPRKFCFLSKTCPFIFKISGPVIQSRRLYWNDFYCRIKVRPEDEASRLLVSGLLRRKFIYTHWF